MEVFNILKVVRAPECTSTKLEILTARYVFPLFFWQEFWLPDINHKFLTYSYIIWSLTLTEFYNLHQKCYIILVGTVQRIKIGRIEKMIAKILKIMNKTYLILYSLSTKCFSEKENIHEILSLEKQKKTHALIFFNALSIF